MKNEEFKNTELDENSQDTVENNNSTLNNDFDNNIVDNADSSSVLSNEENAEDSNIKNKDKDKKDNIVLKIIIAILIIIIIILLLLKSCNKDNVITDNVKNVFDLTQDESVTEGGLEHKSQEEIQAELNKQVAEGMINISMNLTPVFDDGESEGNLLIINEDINRYPQVVEIYLKDTDELIYKSGAIPVGSKIESDTLDVDLDAGEYDCTAYFNAVNPDTGELVGRAGAEVKITVLK